MIVCAVFLASLGPVSAEPPTVRLLKRKVINYSLAAGASSEAFTLPANVPVLVQGTELTLGHRGVAQATVLRIPDELLEWVGLESTAGAAITQGYSAGTGTHILFLDYNHQVDIQVNDANSFIIHNGSLDTRTGQVTLTYSK
jgi:hypothetical protein